MNFIDNSIDMSKVHLYKSNKSLLNDKDLSKLKLQIKENVKPPSKDIKVYIVSFSVNVNRDKPLKFIITQYTLTPKLALIPKNDDITQTFTYTLDELKKYKFKEEYIGKIINIIKKGEKIFKKMTVSIADALDN